MTIDIPLIIRGNIIEDYDFEYSDSHAVGAVLRTPKIKRYLGLLCNDRPTSLLDLYRISLDDIIDLLHELSGRLNLDTNPHWRRAYEASCLTSNLSAPVLEAIYRSCPLILQRDAVRELIDCQTGAACLDGWVPRKLLDGRALRFAPLVHGGCTSLPAMCRSWLSPVSCAARLPAVIRSSSCHRTIR